MLAPIGFIIAVVIVAYLAWKRAPVRDCRWRMDRSRDREGQSFYHCIHCGATTWTDDGKAPKVCYQRTREG